MYFRITTCSIDPARKNDFIEQSKSLKFKIREQLGEGILSARMVEIGEGKLLLIGIYDSEENAIRGRKIAKEIFKEMDENFLLTPPENAEGPTIYSVDY